MEWIKRHRYWILIVAALALLALLLHFEGRFLWIADGHVKLWSGAVNGPENSQQLLDWYSLTHVLHGLAFYLLLWLVDRKKKLSFAAKLLIAVGLAAGWELIENSSLIIERYRSATFSLDYYGDTIINSIGDVLCMMLGFWFAYRTPILASVALFVFIELLLAYTIRDNLTLNVIMLIYPVKAIRVWQFGS